MRREQQLLSSLDIWCSLFHHEIAKNTNYWNHREVLKALKDVDNTGKGSDFWNLEPSKKVQCQTVRETKPKRVHAYRAAWKLSKKMSAQIS